jgi:DNA-binding MarR family transcriptional regulator
MVELAAHEWVRAPTITVAIRRLEKLGLVQRSGDACDKRAVLVSITPRGLAMLRESLTSRRAALVAILSELSESDPGNIDQGVGAAGTPCQPTGVQPRA